MKTTLMIALIALTYSTEVFAQAKKMTTPPSNVVKQPVILNSYTPSYSSNNSEASGNFGLVGGAINIGASYLISKGDYGLGGYFFMQTSKEKNNLPIVSQVTALGAMIKLVLVDKNSIKAYVAPGVGFAMIKEGSISASGSKSDENIISPTFKMGVQFKTTPTFSIGLERMQFANWLNDGLNNYAGPAEYYSVIGSFVF